MLQGKIAERLTSEETAKALGARRKKFVQALLKKTEADAAKSVKKAPHDKLDPLLPKILAHNLARPEVREALVGELHEVRKDLSGNTLGELLELAGLRDFARETLHIQALPVTRSLVQSAVFEAFWTSLHPA